jgi:hypothetical protein
LGKKLIILAKLNKFGIMAANFENFNITSRKHWSFGITWARVERFNIIEAYFGQNLITLA